MSAVIPLPSDLHLERIEKLAREQERTVSELLFESVCKDKQIDCNPIDEGQSKTPDFELLIDDQVVIAEVKELVKNREEQEVHKLLEKGIHKAYGEKTGARVRKKIRRSGPQLKARAAAVYPGMLVLYQDGRLADLHDPHLPAAMYGDFTIEYKGPEDRSVSPSAVRSFFGQGKEMTRDANTTISAVGVIFRNSSKGWDFDLVVYHNRYAAICIEPELLARRGIRQFYMNFDTQTWEAYK